MPLSYPIYCRNCGTKSDVEVIITTDPVGKPVAVGTCPVCGSEVRRPL